MYILICIIPLLFFFYFLNFNNSLEDFEILLIVEQSKFLKILLFIRPYLFFEYLVPKGYCIFVSHSNSIGVLSLRILFRAGLGTSGEISLGTPQAHVAFYR